MMLSAGLSESLNTNEELLSKLIYDVKEIFSTMVGISDLQYLPIQVDPVTQFQDCISSMVGLAGTYNGLVSLHMSSDLAVKTASDMLGLEVSEVNGDVNFALGEITNMIAGSFKNHISKGGLDVHLSIPTVIYGKEYIFMLRNKPDQIAVRFAKDDDWFIVAVDYGKTYLTANK